MWSSCLVGGRVVMGAHFNSTHFWMIAKFSFSFATALLICLESFLNSSRQQLQHELILGLKRLICFSHFLDTQDISPVSMDFEDEEDDEEYEADDVPGENFLPCQGTLLFCLLYYV